MKFIIDTALFLMIYGIGETIANFFIFPKIMLKYLRRAPTPSAEDQKAHTEAPSEDEATHQEAQKTGIARLKGLLERFALFLGLAMGVEQILTLFSALKLGTHFFNDSFKGTDHEKISKDYFLIGNLLSVLLALVYTLLWKWLQTLITMETLSHFCA